MILRSILCILLSSGLLLAQELENEPEFSHTRGFYDEPFELTISAPVENAVIKYTLDGKAPRKGIGNESSSPVALNVDPSNLPGPDTAPGICVRAVAYLDDQQITRSVTHTYIFLEHIASLSPDGQKPGPEWPKINMSNDNRHFFDYGMDPDVTNDSRYKEKLVDAFLDIPTFSMVINLQDLFDPESGIYINAVKHGRQWERECSLELIYPDGEEGFQVNCGVRVRGGWSRNNRNPKHAFRYFFRGEYGPGKLEYELFENEGAEEFDHIDLRTAQNYSWSYQGHDRNTFLRDIFSRDTQRDMGQPYTRGRYYHLFLNGTYWGLFQTQERSEADYAETYFGGDEEDYDVVKVDGGIGRPYDVEATDGNLETWNHLWEICTQGFYSNENYFNVLGLNPDGSPNPDLPKMVDLDNLIDYMLCTFYVGDFDGPLSSFRNNQDPNNFYGIYNRVTPDGFKFFRHDAEHSLFHFRGADRTGPYPGGQRQEKFNPQWLHQQLSMHPEYRLAFADRVYKHFFNDGALTPAACENRLLQRKEQIDLAIIAESARWGDAKSNRPKTRDRHWLPEVNWILENYFPGRTDAVLDQLVKKQLYPPFNPPFFSAENGVVEPGFQLSMSAEQGTVYYTTDGTDPHAAMTGEESTLRIFLPYHNEKRVLVPQQTQTSLWRRQLDYDDSDWTFCSGTPGGVGYELSDGYESRISCDVSAHMHENKTSDPNGSCYIRIPFTISQSTDKLNALFLNIEYDDGFVAYLNGIRIAEANNPGRTQWNSFATQNHEAGAAETYDISQFIDALNSGENLLAIHGLNVSTSSSDFLINAQLTGQLADEQEKLVSPTAREYKQAIPIHKTTHIKARSLLKNRWSALNSVTLAVSEELAGLNVTEIHYHPLNQDSVDGDEYEFLELKNLSAGTINLTKARFVDGIEYEFPAGTQLAHDEFILLVSNATRFQERYGLQPFADYEGNLSNGGERLTMISAAGDTIFDIDYDDDAPWPTEPDTDGYSLVPVRLTPWGKQNEPFDWVSSAQVHGSPGKNDSSSDVKESNISPAHFKLNNNYPNPFNAATTITWQQPLKSHITLKIHDVLGKHVVTLVNEVMQKGHHKITWKAKDVPSGVYFYSLHSSDFHQTRKCIVLR